MPNETIVLTGATGFCGFAILQSALKANNHIRIVVRSQAKATSLRTNPALKTLNLDSQCSYFIVPDLSLPGSLDEACAGADYMIHAASPLPFNTLPAPSEQYKTFVEPAVLNTISALCSAKRSKSIKRVVITSSCAVYITPELLSGPVTTPVFLTEENRNEEIFPPYKDVLSAYVASKTSAFLKSECWMAEHKPEFDVVNLAPTYVMGRHGLASSPRDLLATSNVLFLRMALGLAPAGSAPEVATVVHIDDVVAVHLAALDRQKIPAGEYLFGQRVAWNDVCDITRRLFPEQVEKGVLACDADVPTKDVVFGKKRTEETFGIELKGVQEMVRDVVGQYLELLSKQQ